jgi:hypothetical protein
MHPTVMVKSQPMEASQPRRGWHALKIAGALFAWVSLVWACSDSQTPTGVTNSDGGASFAADGAAGPTNDNVVGPAGKTILADGIKLEVPAGAVDGDVTLTSPIASFTRRDVSRRLRPRVERSDAEPMAVIAGSARRNSVDS